MERPRRLVEDRGDGDPALRDALQAAHHLLRGRRVEAGGRRRRRGRRARRRARSHVEPPPLAERDAALLAVADERVAHALEAEALQRELDLRLARRGGQVGRQLEARGETQRLDHRQRWQHDVLLRHEAEQRAVRARVDGAAVEATALVEPQLARQREQRRRLPGARRPVDPVEAAGRGGRSRHAAAAGRSAAGTRFSNARSSGGSAGADGASSGRSAS